MATVAVTIDETNVVTLINGQTIILVMDSGIFYS
jgi:hypothetical protein